MHFNSETKTYLLKTLNQKDGLFFEKRFSRISKISIGKIAIGAFSKVFFAATKKPLLLNADLFFGESMKVPAPLGLEYYFYGCKIHPSEIKLTKFLINNLKPGEVFFDIGAHLGFYSLLASFLVGERGQIHSFEPLSEIFPFLRRNVQRRNNIVINNLAVSDRNGESELYALPLLQSENSSIIREWIEKQGDKTGMVLRSVKSITLDEYPALPNIVKIDTERAEFLVLKGAEKILLQEHPLVVMEFDGGSKEHKDAARFLKEKGYTLYKINVAGGLEKVADLTNVDMLVGKKEKETA